MEKVIKRNRKQVPFDPDKIRIALHKANSEVPKKHRVTDAEIDRIVREIAEIPQTMLGVEAIQNIIEEKLIDLRKHKVVSAFIAYRYKHKLRREANSTDNDIAELLCGSSDYWNNENSNKNARVVTTQRDYIAGISSTDISRRLLLPEEIVKAHDAGIIHFHDMDYFAQNALHNCDLINGDDMLQNGTMINGVKIDRPHWLNKAVTIMTQFITAVASSQYGGCTITLTHLAPFVRESYIKYLQEGLKLFENKSDYKVDRLVKWINYNGINLISNKEFEEQHPQTVAYASMKIKQEIESAVQTFNYQINSMSTTNGQAPFISVMMYLNETDEYKDELAMLIEEFLKQRIIGMKNRKGVYVTPAFPKLLYVLEEDNIHEDSKYFYLTKLAAECTAKRLVPDYISEKIMKELKGGDCYPCMGCRSFLTPDRTSPKLGNIANAGNYVEGKHKYYGRFNQGVVTINLPDVAFSSKGDMNKFWEIFDDRLELCHRALQCRHRRLLGTPSDAAPILWQDGALARLQPDETIDKLLFDGYSTISLGYGGLYECVKYITGHSHTDGAQGREFGLKVMQHMNDMCAKWKQAENIDYSIYGTPMESTTYKFAKCLKKRFGDDIFVKLDGKDRNYITNSYHVPVFEEIDAFDKLGKEAEFQKLSPGGAISYIETSNLTKNPEAVIEVMKFIYNNIMYAELNTKSDYCQKCGYTGEILIDDNLEWYCPNCGCRDHNFLNVARRTCGYIGSNFWNKGRTDEIKNRVLHLDNKECK